MYLQEDSQKGKTGEDFSTNFLSLWNGFGTHHLFHMYPWVPRTAAAPEHTPKATGRQASCFLAPAFLQKVLGAGQNSVPLFSSWSKALWQLWMVEVFGPFLEKQLVCFYLKMELNSSLGFLNSINNNTWVLGMWLNQHFPVWKHLAFEEVSIQTCTQCITIVKCFLWGPVEVGFYRCRRGTKVRWCELLTREAVYDWTWPHRG